MDQPFKLSDPIEEFLTVVDAEVQKKSQLQQKKKVLTEEEANQIAYWYEKIRAAIDYREDHLLRRTAARRILKRIFIFEGRTKGIADMLLKELIMGGYLKKEDLDEDKLVVIDKVLEKYSYAFTLTGGNLPIADGKSAEKRRWLTTLASFEVEEILYPSLERRALVNAMYKLLAPRVVIEDQSVPEEQKNVHVYMAIYRSLAKADRAMAASELFRVYYPDWFGEPSQSRIAEIVNDIDRIATSIYAEVRSVMTNKIFHAIKKQTYYANILLEITTDNREDIRGVLGQEYILRDFVQKKAAENNDRVYKKLQKRISRGIIYIFLTKMVIALVVEVPVERLMEGKINYVALAINLFFPPIFMAFIAKSARFPDAANTEAIVEGVEGLVYDDPSKDEIKKISVGSPLEGFSNNVLNFIYFLVFGAVFGLLIYILRALHFDYISGAIFLIFMCTVSFFGALIRQSVRELSVTREKESIGSLFFDTMLLPFVRFGRWIATNFSRINFFMFILDVIIEAPFRMIIRLFEAWIVFLRKKREEIDHQFG